MFAVNIIGGGGGADKVSHPRHSEQEQEPSPN